MTSVKKWVTKGTGYEGDDSFFRTKTEAVEHARKVLASGKKRQVRIGRFSEEKYRQGKVLRQCYDTIETWLFVAPRRIGKVKVGQR